jgi:hypothetical protein
MPNPTRYVADVSGLVPWVADDILAGLPRAAPESAMEAMMMARRNIPVDDSKFTNIIRERKGLEPGYERGTVYLPQSLTTWNQDDAARMAYKVPMRKRAFRSGPQPYPVDPVARRAMSRQAMAEAYLDQARQNPEIASMLPMGLRPGILPDKLLARLAAESPQVVLRKALQENPEIVGGLMGAGGVMGGGIAYGLLSDE